MPAALSLKPLLKLSVGLTCQVYLLEIEGYLLKDRDEVGLSAGRSAGSFSSTVLIGIGRTGFNTRFSTPDLTLSLTESLNGTEIELKMERLTTLRSGGEPQVQAGLPRHHSRLRHHGYPPQEVTHVLFQPGRRGAVSALPVFFQCKGMRHRYLQV